MSTTEQAIAKATIALQNTHTDVHHAIDRLYHQGSILEAKALIRKSIHQLANALEIL